MVDTSLRTVKGNRKRQIPPSDFMGKFDSKKDLLYYFKNMRKCFSLTLHCEQSSCMCHLRNTSPRTFSSKFSPRRRTCFPSEK